MSDGLSNPLVRAAAGMLGFAGAVVLGALGMAVGSVLAVVLVAFAGVQDDRAAELAFSTVAVVSGATGAGLAAAALAWVVEDVRPRGIFWRVWAVPMMGIAAAIGTALSPLQAGVAPGLAALFAGLGAAGLAGLALIDAGPDEDAARRREAGRE